METSATLDELNDCHTLFLQEIVEPRANALKLVLREGRLSKISVALEVAGQSLGEGFPVEIDDTCSTFELSWNFYVRYQVTNESFACGESAGEERVGTKARLHEKSGLLEYVLNSTNASHEYPGKLLHFEIVCADHVIDVISTTFPNCRRTSPKLRVN